MGQGESKDESKEKANDDLRMKVIHLFEGQQLLVFGFMGSGKTSLINSFNHVINRSVDKSAAFQEVGEFALSQEHVTLTYETFGPTKNMYHLLKRENKRQWEQGPKFFDLPGINSKMVAGQQRIDQMAQLLTHLVRGQVKEFTEIVSLCDPAADLKGLDEQIRVDKRRPWSILCVLPLDADFQTEILKIVDKVERASKQDRGGWCYKQFQFVSPVSVRRVADRH